MSRRLSTRETINRATLRPGRFPRASMGMLVWLTGVWVLLWGKVTTGNIVAGFLIALLITTLTPLPATPFDGRFRPRALATLAVTFVRDLIVASAQITVHVLTGRQPRGAMIEVHTRSHSDVFLTLTAGMTSLVPGSVVIDINRTTGVLSIHIFDVELAGGLDAAHRAVLRQEEMILRAFASPAQLADAGLADDCGGDDWDEIDHEGERA